MVYLAEFIGCMVFLLIGYGYMCNVTLKKTLVGTLNYIELVAAWALAVGFGLAINIALGGPGFMNPGVVAGYLAMGYITVKEAGLYVLMEFLGAGVAVALCMFFFWDSFKASRGVHKHSIFAANSVGGSMLQNFFQEVLATFIFLLLVLGILTSISGATTPLKVGATGAAAVAALALSLNSTGFSMNAMRSFFSSIWFAVLPIPEKSGEDIGWSYQFVVNCIGSTIGGILAVVAVSLMLY